VKEGFIVLPYFTDDLIMAKKLLDAGCPAVMPLAAPIGSGMGVQNPSNLRIMREQLPDATIIVDAAKNAVRKVFLAGERQGFCLRQQQRGLRVCVPAGKIVSEGQRSSPV